MTEPRNPTYIYIYTDQNEIITGTWIRSYIDKNENQICTVKNEIVAEPRLGYILIK